ncbi:MAG: hypothetical protein V3R30_02710, partial [Kiloniellales bacterium]
RIANPSLAGANEQPTNDLAKEPQMLGGVLGAAAAKPPHLAAVIAAWPRLPQAVRAGIVAMVHASAGD